MSRKRGRLYGIGLGPGDPELLTLKGARILREVDLVYAPQARTSGESYSLRIAREFIDPDRQEIIRLFFPTNDEKAAGEVWSNAADQLAGKLRKGLNAAFITEGDPSIYSTFSYVMESLSAKHPELPVEIIPGVTSVTAAAAAARAPLVTHGQNLAILPAAYGIDGLMNAIDSNDTVVLMKVNRALVQALSVLEQSGLGRKSVYVKRASTDREEIVHDLDQLAKEDLDYFSLLIIRSGQ